MYVDSYIPGVNIMWKTTRSKEQTKMTFSIDRAWNLEPKNAEGNSSLLRLSSSINFY